MDLSIKEKNVNLVLRTKKIVNITHTLKGKNFEEVFFTARNNMDLDALSKIIYTLAENEEKKNPFGTSQDVYDFLDEYKNEYKKTYEDIFNDLTEFINEEGFFNKKMTKEELLEKTDGLMSSLDTQSIVKNVVEKTVSQVAEEEFRGFKG